MGARIVEKNAVHFFIMVIKMYSIPEHIPQPKWVHDHFSFLNRITEREPSEKLENTSKLTNIADKYKDSTDKTPHSDYYIKHSYTEFYGDILERFVGKEANLLEIGVRFGGSLQMWKDFLVNGTVYGVDLNLDLYRYPPHPQIHLLKTNAYGPRVEENVFPGVLFDVIVDDGSHFAKDQVEVLNLYLTKLKPGGICIIEDIQMMETAKQIVENFKGRRNKVSIIDRRHCVPSLDDIIVVYFNT